MAERRSWVILSCWITVDLIASVLLFSIGNLPNLVLFVVRAIAIVLGVLVALSIGKGLSICSCFGSGSTFRRSVSGAAAPLAKNDSLGTGVDPDEDVIFQRARAGQMSEHRWKADTAVVVFFCTVAIEAVYTGMQISEVPNRWSMLAVSLCTTIACMCFEFFSIKKVVNDLVSDKGIYLPGLHEHTLHYTENISLALCNVCRKRIGKATGGNEAFKCLTCADSPGKIGSVYHLCLVCYRKQSTTESVSDGILRGDKGPKPSPDLSAWDYAKRTAKMAAPFKCNFIAAILCIVIAELSNVLLPSQQGQIINALSDEDESKFATILKSYVLLSVTAAAFNAIKDLTVQLVAKRLQLAIRSDMFTNVMKQDMAFFDGVMTGQLTSRMTNDVGSVTSPITQVMNVFFTNVIRFIGGAFMCFTTSWKLTILALTLIGPVIYIMNVYAQWSKEINLTVRAKLGDANGLATETLRNVRTVRSFGAVWVEKMMFDDALAQAWNGMRKDAWAAAGIGAVVGYVNFSAGVLVYWYGGRAVLSGSDSTLNLGNLITFRMYWGMLSGSIQNMNGLLNTMIVAASAAKRVYEIVDLEPDIKIDDPEATPLEQLVPVGQACSVEFRNVHFTYQSRPDTKVFAGLSFTIPAGTTAAFVGPSGGGKSTAFLLLLRFYDPQEGEVLVHGVPLPSVNLRSYQSRIAVVSQETQMFARTIRENLTYGMDPESFTNDDIIMATERANAHDFIMQMDRGYDTILGEGGGGMSGGQKQRLSISRAFLRKPQLLFLDEATSALDSENEKQIQGKLDEMIEQMGAAVSVIMIAHRLSTVMGCDKIIVINQGQVHEQGSHAELMENDKIYAQLVRTQKAKDTEAAEEVERPPGEKRGKGKGTATGKGKGTSGTEGREEKGSETEGRGEKEGWGTGKWWEGKGWKGKIKQGKRAGFFFGQGGPKGGTIPYDVTDSGEVVWKNLNDLSQAERRQWLKYRMQGILQRALAGFGTDEVSDALVDCINDAIDSEPLDNESFQGESTPKARDPGVSIATLFSEISQKTSRDT